MKVAALLSQFLYTNKQMDLAGIGRFSFTPEPSGEGEKNKQGKLPGIISFSSDTSTSDDQALIDYIAKQTGKMKPLATSDLHSFIELATEFLNIGKAFHIEGIGTLIKNPEGKFSFTQGQVLNEKIKEPGLAKDATRPVTEEEPFKGYDDPFVKRDRVKVPVTKFLLPLLLLAGVALAIWGGYHIYKSSSGNQAPSAGPTVPVEDTTAATTQVDSTALKDSAARSGALPPGTYKFVYETTTSKRRALSRFKQVHELIPEIQLQALNDSSLFKIYIVKTTEDTARTKLELKAWYYGTLPKYVTIE